MARIRIPALLLLVLTLAGCPALFDTNLFSALDVPPAPKASDYEGAAGLDKLAADLASPSVVALLAADSTTTGQIASYLYATYDLGNPAADADAQTAAALYADLYLKTTPGEDLVNNIVGALVTAPPTGNIGDIIASIIPAAALANAATFADMVNGLLAAAVAYEALGDSLPSTGVLPPPPGVNMGDVAQKAAVAYLMRVVVDACIAAPGVGTEAAAIDELFKLATNVASLVDTVTITDPYTPGPANQYLQNIFDAAGAPYPG